MGEISSYFGEVLVIVATSGLLLAAAPEGKLKKSIRWILSLTLLTALILPMLTIAAKLPSAIGKSEYRLEGEQAAVEENTENALILASKREIEDAICSLVSEKFRVPREKLACEITLDLADTQRIGIDTIALRVPKGSDRERIERELKTMFLEKSEIVVTEES